MTPQYLPNQAPTPVTMPPSGSLQEDLAVMTALEALAPEVRVELQAAQKGFQRLCLEAALAH